MEPTTATKLGFAWSLPVAAALLCSALVAQTETPPRDIGTSIAPARSVMITASGPRKGEAPGRYFNVQGLSSRGDSKFASYGLLDFDIEPGQPKAAGTIIIYCMYNMPTPAGYFPPELGKVLLHLSWERHLHRGK